MKLRLLAAAVMLAMVPALWAAQWAVAKSRSQERPNVVVFLTDDQPPRSLNVMPKTSAWFGSSSTRFTNAFVTTPLCCPSRASFFTGRYAHNHGLSTNWVEKQAADLDQGTTFQHHLDGSGYRTAIFGKYLNSWNLDWSPPHFDEWAIFAHSRTANYGRGKWNIDQEVGPIDAYSADLIGARAEKIIRGETTARRVTLLACAVLLVGGAVAMIRKHAGLALVAMIAVMASSSAMAFVTLSSDKPWMIILSTSAPHVPSVLRTENSKSPVPVMRQTPAREEIDLTDKPQFVRDGVQDGSWASFVRRKQLRALWSVDDLVDKVMRSVADTGDLSHTLALFTSDNGLLWGDHGNVGKGYPYTSSITVPLMFRWPEELSMPDTDRRMVTNLDLAPTILDVTGIPYSSGVAMDGRSLLDTSKRRNRVLIEFEEQGFGVARPCPEKGCIPGWRSLRTPGYQYTEYYDRGKVQFREYYDLRQDPWQLENLLGDASRKNDPDVESMETQLRDDIHCVGLDCP